MLKIVLLFLAIFQGIGVSFSQNPVDPVPKGFPKPSWVMMMDDSMVNYHAAVKTFEDYWKVNRKPKGESEEMEEAEKKGKELTRQERERAELKRKSKGKDSKLPPQTVEVQEYLKYQMKRFENWSREVKPWVQEDGHILTEHERKKLNERQQ